MIKEFKTGLSGKIILFDGDYREREINIYFAINPKLEELTYSRLFPENGEFFDHGEIEVEEPEFLLERLHVKNALVGI